MTIEFIQTTEIKVYYKTFFTTTVYDVSIRLSY